MKRQIAACLLFALTGVASSMGCVASDDDPAGDETEVSVGETKADGTTQVAIRSGYTRTLSFTATGEPVDVTVYCNIAGDPDQVGTQFTVQSAALGLTTASKPVDGYWQWSGELAAGPQKIKLKGASGNATCNVSITKVSGSCTSSTSFHSPETGHTHMRVGTTIAGQGAFPASGNHWGAWAKWNTVYTKPVLRGYYLHNLEHGGAVLSYRCSSPTESAECAEAAANLEALKEASGETRIIVTPDPQQESMYGVRTWRFGMQSDCYDEGRLGDFLASTIKHGREDEDSDPPIPFDPSTTTVSCHDLMAAPDSCN